MTSRPPAGYRAGLRQSTDSAAPADYVTDISYTEYASAGCTVGITSDNAVYVAPVFTTDGVGVLRSDDAGQSWHAVVPEAGSHRRSGAYLYVDAHEDRVLFHTARFGATPAALGASGFDLSICDEPGGHGATWRTRKVASKARNWGKMFAGPTVAGRTNVGSPDRVTYLSAPTPFSTRIRPWTRAQRQLIWRSYDGGRKWEIAGGFDIDPSVVPGLPAGELVVFGKGVVGPDGTVYLGGRYGRRFAVAVSRDEGETWSVDMVPGSALARYRNPVHYALCGWQLLLPEPIAVDSDGNVYVLWPDRDGILHAAWSSDGASTWSRPVVVSAPSVRTTRCGAITATGSGRVGISYYGNEKGREYHGFLAQCREFRSSSPLFVGGKYNEPDAPLYPKGFDRGYRRMLFGGNINEFLGVRFTPDGVLVTAAAMQMTGRNGGRPWAVRSARSATQAVVGRLGRLARD